MPCARLGAGRAGADYDFDAVRRDRARQRDQAGGAVASASSGRDHGRHSSERVIGDAAVIRTADGQQFVGYTEVDGVLDVIVMDTAPPHDAAGSGDGKPPRGGLPPRASEPRAPPGEAFPSYDAWTGAGGDGGAPPPAGRPPAGGRTRQLSPQRQAGESAAQAPAEPKPEYTRTKRVA